MVRCVQVQDKADSTAGLLWPGARVFINPSFSVFMIHILFYYHCHFLGKLFMYKWRNDTKWVLNLDLWTCRVQNELPSVRWRRSSSGNGCCWPSCGCKSRSYDNNCILYLWSSLIRAVLAVNSLSFCHLWALEEMVPYLSDCFTSGLSFSIYLFSCLVVWLTRSVLELWISVVAQLPCSYALCNSSALQQHVLSCLMNEAAGTRGGSVQRWPLGCWAADGDCAAVVFTLSLGINILQILQYVRASPTVWTIY